MAPSREDGNSMTAAFKCASGADQSFLLQVFQALSLHLGGFLAPHKYPYPHNGVMSACLRSSPGPIGHVLVVCTRELFLLREGHTSRVLEDVQEKRVSKGMLQ